MPFLLLLLLLNRFLVEVKTVFQVLFILDDTCGSGPCVHLRWGAWEVQPHCESFADRWLLPITSVHVLLVDFTFWGPKSQRKKSLHFCFYHFVRLWTSRVVLITLWARIDLMSWELIRTFAFYFTSWLVFQLFIEHLLLLAILH